jgi:alpha-tubulin suppressor-like RCC1 family protein
MPPRPAALLLSLASCQVLGVAAGAHHTLLCTEQGEVLAFGRGGSGCLGLGDADDQESPAVVDGVVV